jgi:cell division control protein 6
LRYIVNVPNKNCITEQKSGSMYISGAPGCGKTALLRELHTYFTKYEKSNVRNKFFIKDFHLIILMPNRNVQKIPESSVFYVNCMHLQTPESIFRYLCDSLELPPARNKKMNAEQQLRQFFTSCRAEKPKTPASKTRKRTATAKTTALQGMVILIADEIDRLKTTDNHVLYSLFELSALPNSPFILISIANALDMTDRVLPRLQNSICK